MKPLEFKIEEYYDSVNEDEYYLMIFYYENGDTSDVMIYDDLPEGLELNKHYSISDLYGYKVKNDREGL